MVEKQTKVSDKFYEKKNILLLFTDYIPMIQNKNIQKFMKATKISETFYLKNFIYNSSINTSTMILEKKYLKNVKFRNLDLMEDYIFKCDLMRNSKIPFKKFSRASAIYRIINDSRSSKKYLTSLICGK